MSMQQIEIAQNDRQTVQGQVTRHGSIGNKGVTIMSTITRTAHGTRFGVGMMAAIAVALAAFLSISLWPLNSPTVLEAPATERGSFSPLPAGLTDYQGLQTAPARPSFSALPQGLTDYQGLFTERAASTPLPQGLTDYVALQPKARVNHSAVPQGLTDYQGLQAVALRSNFSPLPASLTDYQSLGN